MSVTPDRLKAVLGRLESGTGNREDIDLVLAASQSPNMDRLLALRALCSASCSARDLGLWRSAVTTFAGDESITKLETERILQAIIAFGHSALQPQ